MRQCSCRRKERGGRRPGKAAPDPRRLKGQTSGSSLPAVLLMCFPVPTASPLHGLLPGLWAAGAPLSSQACQAAPYETRLQRATLALQPPTSSPHAPLSPHLLDHVAAWALLAGQPSHPLHVALCLGHFFLATRYIPPEVVALTCCRAWLSPSAGQMGKRRQARLGDFSGSRSGKAVEPGFKPRCLGPLQCAVSASPAPSLDPVVVTAWTTPASAEVPSWSLELWSWLADRRTRASPSFIHA